MDSRQQEVEARLLRFVRTEYVENAIDIDAETALFSSGLVDSFSLLALLAFIEREFTVRLAVSRLEQSQCDTVRGFAELIAEADHALKP